MPKQILVHRVQILEVHFIAIRRHTYLELCLIRDQARSFDRPYDNRSPLTQILPHTTILCLALVLRVLVVVVERLCRAIIREGLFTLIGACLDGTCVDRFVGEVGHLLTIEQVVICDLLIHAIQMWLLI